MHTVEIINFMIMCLFFVCYSYQFFYIPLSWLPRKSHLSEGREHRIAVLIAARNEERVIGKLLDSVKAQSYPSRLVSTFVVADHCRDKTAAIARERGATVFERWTGSGQGKGYALNYLLSAMHALHADDFDAYIVLDADNVLDKDFIRNIDRTHCEGYDIVTCYRNSKNYGDSWISAGTGLWFLREARYLNAVRMSLGVSCAISGTGFLFSKAILENYGGWNFFLLTEDIEFTIDNVIRGEKIGYCPDAVVYDEQPVTFRQSWVQRLRWSRGYMQVFARYGKRLVSGIFHGSFSCYDMAMSIMPAAVLTALSLVVNLGAAVANFLVANQWAALGVSVLQTLVSLYLTIFLIGVITTMTEWKHIHCAAWKKLCYAITFPVFMLSFVPICIESLFITPDWKPIIHNRVLDAKQVCESK